MAPLRIGQIFMLAAAVMYLLLAVFKLGSLPGTLVLFFIMVSSLGLILGNATSLALEAAPSLAGGGGDRRG